MKRVLIGVLCLLFLLPLGMQAASLVHKFYDVQILHNLIVDNAVTADSVTTGSLTIVGGAGLANHRGALVFLPSAQPIHTTTFPLYYTAESYDTDNTHSITTDNAYIYIPDNVTKVRVYGVVRFAPVDNNALCQVEVLKNGLTTYAGAVTLWGGYADASGVKVVPFSTAVIDVVGNDNISVGARAVTSSPTVAGDNTGKYTWVAMDIVQ